jgi:hypothetical protein
MRMAGQQLPRPGVWAFGGARTTPEDVQEIIAQLALKHGGPVVHGGAGPRLDTPRERLVVWTPAGQDVGGTGHAIRAARHFGIPVYNLGNPRVMDRAMQYLRSEQAS